MTLPRPWDTIRTSLRQFSLPPALETALRWVQRHPQAVAATSLIVVMAALLAQSPAKPAREQDAYGDEVPLFI